MKATFSGVGAEWVVCGICLLLAGRAAAQDALPGDLSGYLRFSMAHNPQVAQARAMVEADREEYRVSLALPDPQISAGYFISEVETRVGPQQAKLGASQAIPWPGKIAAKRRAAREGLRASEQMLEAVRAGALANVRAKFASLYAVGQSISITKEDLLLLQQLESVLLARYATAAAKQMSLLKVQIEIAMLEDRIRGFESVGESAKNELCAAIGVSPTRDIPYPETLDYLALGTDTAGIVEAAVRLNPVLKKAAHDVLASEAMTGMARQGFAPNLMLMTDYIFTDKSTSSMVLPSENGKDPWVVGVSMSVPLWAGSKSSAVRKARAMEWSKKAELDDVEISLSARAASMREELYDAERKIGLFDKVLIPKARQSIAVVQEAYANGSATILDFLDAQRTLLDLEISLAQQRARRETIAGKIDMLLGGKYTQRALGNSASVQGE